MNQKYITIGDLNRYIKTMFENNTHLTKVYLKGEISNFKHHTRGHLYFTLKDDESRISAIMFASSTSKLNFEPIDGMKVLVEGRISTYPEAGTYQIYVNNMEQDGLGSLYIEYEKLKKKLSEEGLFNKEHKRSIPLYPKKIGIITAPTGAAIRDILSTIKRRYPICETILFPALVQGTGGAASIVKNLKLANTYDLDLIICGRGGGSIEDLWNFNEEAVAREIYNSKIPVISAVGHEIDFTIADYVADLRAPTPTGAAEMSVPNITDILTNIKNYEIRAKENVISLIKHDYQKYNALASSFILKNPLAIYEVKEQKLDNYIDKLNKYIKDTLLLKKHNYALLVNTLELVNPLNILKKGYSLVTKDNKVITSSKNININDVIDIKLESGSIKASVMEKK